MHTAQFVGALDAYETTPYTLGSIDLYNNIRFYLNINTIDFLEISHYVRCQDAHSFGNRLIKIINLDFSIKTFSILI